MLRMTTRAVAVFAGLSAGALIGAGAGVLILAGAIADALWTRGTRRRAHSAAPHR